MALARVQSPEEVELDLKRAELAEFKQDLVERELELSSLQQDLATSETNSFQTLGRRYATLDDINARVAEARAAQRSADQRTSGHAL